MGRSWSSVYGKLVLGVWKELRLTGRGGRRGEKGYSDSREQECAVGYDKAGRSAVKVRLMGGRQGRQGTEAAYFASSGPKRQKKPALRRMGKLEKTRKGRLGKDCEEWDTYDSLQGVLYGRVVAAIDRSNLSSRRSESDHRRSKKQLHAAT